MSEIRWVSLLFCFSSIALCQRPIQHPCLITAVCMAHGSVAARHGCVSHDFASTSGAAAPRVVRCHRRSLLPPCQVTNTSQEIYRAVGKPLPDGETDAEVYVNQTQVMMMQDAETCRRLLQLPAMHVTISTPTTCSYHSSRLLWCAA